MHNLFILLYSYCHNDNEKSKQDLIEYLQKPIKAHEINKRTKKKINDEEVYFDLYFAKTIFDKLVKRQYSIYYIY